jgi:hypothetical protein
MTASTISDFGISLDLAPGWYGEVFRTVYGITETGPVLHAANTPLILTDQNGYAPVARQTLRSNDAILCIINLPSLPGLVTGESLEQRRFGEGWSLSGADGTPFTGVPNTQSSLRKGVRVGERVFDLVAFFGSPTPQADVLSQLEQMLGTIGIAPAPPVRGKRIEQFFSIASAIAIQEQARAELWARDAPNASAEERAEHQKAFPGKG